MYTHLPKREDSYCESVSFVFRGIGQVNSYVAGRYELYGKKGSAAISTIIAATTNNKQHTTCTCQHTVQSAVCMEIDQLNSISAMQFTKFFEIIYRILTVYDKIYWFFRSNFDMDLEIFAKEHIKSHF